MSEAQNPRSAHGAWVRCEDVTWNTDDGTCPIGVPMGPHEHRVKPNGEVGIMVRSLEVPKAGITFGDPVKRALRITKGRLSRAGRWHPWQPCVFWIVNGRRVGGD